MSKKFHLNQADIKKWATNTAVFLAPAVLIFLTQIQAGKSWQDSMAAIYVWAISTAIDLTRKFIAGK